MKEEDIQEMRRVKTYLNKEKSEEIESEDRLNQESVQVEKPVKNQSFDKILINEKSCVSKNHFDQCERDEQEMKQFSVNSEEFKRVSKVMCQQRSTT